MTDNDINDLPISTDMKAVLMALNDSTATALGISAANIGLREKAACSDVLNAVATRASLNAYQIPLPVKLALLTIAGV